MFRVRFVLCRVFVGLDGAGRWEPRPRFFARCSLFCLRSDSGEGGRVVEMPLQRMGGKACFSIEVKNKDAIYGSCPAKRDDGVKSNSEPVPGIWPRAS